MNIETFLLDDYINFVDSSLREQADFVDSTKKKNTYFKRNMFLFVVLISIFLFYLSLKDLNEKHFFCRTNIQNS